ncbi:ABC transporter ATP-binding protein [Thalassotalea litorea]|uniref:ABC transporter ATP-binding protein n=1 Tax=Thalassotalea litorea TaxID=2020715 RepID=UPI003735DF46
MVLVINQLNVSYQHQTVLHGVDLTVSEGEIVCLLGSSGCGKTTLLKTIAGLIKTDSGDIVINGNVVNSANHQVVPEHRNLGMLFQDYALFPHLTVNDNIAYGLRKLSKSARQARTTEMLDLVQLPNIGEKYPHQLSGGQQQRVALARALAYQPDLLLLDEPFSNIDAKVKFDLISQIRDIIKRSGVAAIFVSHSKDEAFGFADTIALMENGKIQQTGAPQTLYQEPNCAFVARFMGPLNEIAVQNLPDDTQIQLTKIFGHHFDVTQQTLLIRPENLALNKISDTHNLSIHGTVESTTFYGRQITVYVRCDQQRIAFYLDSQQTIIPGDDITLFFAAEHLLLTNQP